MGEEWRFLVGYDGKGFVLLDCKQGQCYPLGVGSVVALFLSGAWRPVRVAGGGYKGRYYLREDGTRERLAVGMWGRLIGEGG